MCRMWKSLQDVEYRRCLVQNIAHKLQSVEYKIFYASYHFTYIINVADLPDRGRSGGLLVRSGRLLGL